MYFFGLVAFVFVMVYSSYPLKIKKMNSKIKKLEKKYRGEVIMSKILTELINKKCILVTDMGLEIVSKREFECIILDADDEWIKFTFTNKKGINQTQILRIDNIERVELI